MIRTKGQPLELIILEAPWFPVLVQSVKRLGRKSEEEVTSEDTECKQNYQEYQT